MTMRPDLSDDEVNDICGGLKQDAAKARYLQGLGLSVRRRPNGRPLVAREDWQRVWTQQSEPPRAESTANGPRWRVSAGGR